MKRLVLLVLASTMMSCATMVPVQLLKPAEINLGSAKTIAVLPFSYPSQVQAPGLSAYEAAVFRLWFVGGREDKDEKLVAETIANELGTNILATKYFSVLNASELRSSLQQNDANQNIAADVVVTGTITELSFNTVDKSYTNDKNVWVVLYETTTNFTVKYDVILTRDNAILASKTFSATNTTTTDSWELRKNEAVRRITRYDVPEQAKTVTRMLAPYYVTEYRSLENDEAKDPRMESAAKLVQDGFYQKAFDIYTTVYSETKNFAAGFNAAIMRELMGDLESAINAMKLLADDSANPKALKEATRMEKTLADNKAAASQAR